MDDPMSNDEDQSEIVRFLSRPESHRHDVDAIEVITTHASMVFLAGDRAFKLKRALKYSYLDYSTPELRRHACQAEVALNRRTAPTLYLSATPILRKPDGRLSFDAPGEPVDWVVVMRRFPQEALFNHLAEHGALTSKLAFDLANRIAAFHAIADIEPNRGGVEGVALVIQINDENMRRWPPLDISIDDIDRLRGASRTALGKHAALLNRRAATGRVRRCHGDLHLGNICLIDGEPTLFDCIEFSDLISCIDVLYDLAFLLMDLRHRGLVQQCGLVLNRYLDLTNDDDGLPVLPLFMSLRAAVRAHVTATGAAGLGSDPRRQRLAEARSYFDLAMELLQPRPARLIAIGGLSGTGKSSVAAAIAGELGIGAGARVLRSDVLRKQLFGKAPEQRLPDEAYSLAVNDKVYTTLKTRAAMLLRAGHSVIIDAVSARPEERAVMAEVAHQAGARFTGLWLQASEETLLARLKARGEDASDATVDVLRRQLAYDVGPNDWFRVDASRPTEDIASDVRSALRG
jgi:aminoglycoside phosphotransferase family enzyme/predicted kinase